MSQNDEILEFLVNHIQSIMKYDIETYHATTSADLTLYEWFVTPHRIDGIAFHDFMCCVYRRDRRAGSRACL